MSFDYTTLVTDRTQADAAARNDKGTYQAADLNRVTEALEDLESRLAALGYVTGYAPVYILHLDGTTDTVWRENDEDIRFEKFSYWLANVKTIRDVLAQYPETPVTPASLDSHNINNANNIEKILKSVNDLILNLELSYIFCNELYSGEVSA